MTSFLTSSSGMGWCFVCLFRVVSFFPLTETTVLWCLVLAAGGLPFTRREGFHSVSSCTSSPSLLQTLSALAQAAKELRALPASLTTAVGSCFLPGGMSEQVSLASYWCLIPSSSFE